jgi:CpeT protein
MPISSSPRALLTFTFALSLAAAACGGSDADGTTTTGSSTTGGSGGAGPTSSGTGGSGGAGGSGADATSADAAFRMLTGRFDSKDQSMTDKSYYAVQLQTCVVAAPEIGSRVLYVEQALMTKLGSPYRQRLFVIEDAAGSPGTVESHVYDLAAPKAAIGLCEKNPSASFAAADAIEQVGCTVRLTRDEASGAFVGGTEGKACASELNGASYATSKVTLHDDGMETLDQGFDASDMQVWGAVKGPYLFVRRTPLPE